VSPNLTTLWRFVLYLNTTVCTANKVEHSECGVEGGAFILDCYTDKKENQIFLIYQEIQSGAVAKSYMRKGFLTYEEMHKYFPIYEEAVSHI
jgi:hypothetical protein